MRLKEDEIKIIKGVIKEIFGDETKIYLFGSRLDDTKRGGDIDLFLITQNPSYEKKIKAISKLQHKLYKPIDIVLHRDLNREIEKEAIKGVML